MEFTLFVFYVHLKSKYYMYVNKYFPSLECFVLKLKKCIWYILIQKSLVEFITIEIIKIGNGKYSPGFFFLIGVDTWDAEAEEASEVAPAALEPKTAPEAAEAALDTIELNCDDKDSVRRNVSRKRFKEDIDGEWEITLVESSLSWRNKILRVDILGFINWQ